MKAIDFCCGAGGMTRGLLDAGIDVLAGVDIDARLRTTYENNNHPSRFIPADLNAVDIVGLRRELGIVEGDVVVYAACTPCQPFSHLNRMAGPDPRRILLLRFAQIVKTAPPDYIIVENVPGLNNAYGKEIYDEFLGILNRLGFHHRLDDFLNAKEYDVPQDRRRFILLASRHGEITVPKRAIAFRL